MIHAVEIGDLVAGLLYIIGHQVKVEVVFGDHLAFNQVPPNELIPSFPIVSVWGVEQDNGHDRALTRLHQGEGLEHFIHGAEPAWKTDEGVGFLYEQQLPREEVSKGHQLWIASNDGVDLLLERQTDVDAEAALPAGALVRRLHDS